MRISSIQTPESVRQLDGDFWRAVRKLARSKTKYFRNKNTEKVESQEEVLDLFHYLEGLMKQITFKIINHSGTVAKELVNEALANPAKAQENMSKLAKLDQSLKDLEVNSGIGKQMSNAVGNFANGTRRQINATMKNAQSQLAYTAKMRQQAQKNAKPAGKLIPRFRFGGA
ncbi:MAG: hypothetical protein V1831_02945 [Candidatus Woesearchaeota archaeon]